MQILPIHCLLNFSERGTLPLILKVKGTRSPAKAKDKLKLF